MRESKLGGGPSDGTADNRHCHFNDVDLSPEELVGDFSHDGLVDQNELKLIGCGVGFMAKRFIRRNASPRRDLRF